MTDGLNQTESGQAWKYPVAYEVASHKQVGLGPPELAKKYKSNFLRLAPNRRGAAKQLANLAISNLSKVDERFELMTQVDIQADKEKDVRDIVVPVTTGEPIGISAKVNHRALMSPRLSATNDFGKNWYKEACSCKYWNTVKPLFAELNQIRQDSNGKRTWNDLEDKEEKYFIPILAAFMKEIKTCPSLSDLFRSLLGTKDYYRIVNLRFKRLEVTSFNIYGSNQWGDRLDLPSQIISVDMTEDHHSVILTADKNWKVEFRIHSASGVVENSLKLDVNLVGIPDRISTVNLPEQLDLF